MDAPATGAEADRAEPQPTQESGTAGAVGAQVEKEVGGETGPADGTSSDSIKIEGLAVEHGGRGSAVAAPIARDILHETLKRDPSRYSERNREKGGNKKNRKS